MASKTCSRPQKIWKYRDLAVGPSQCILMPSALSLATKNGFLMDHFLKLENTPAETRNQVWPLCRCQAVLRCVLQKHPRNISGRTHTCDVSQETNCCLKAVLKSPGAARKLVPTDSGRDFPRTNDPVDEGISKGKWEKNMKKHQQIQVSHFETLCSCPSHWKYPTVRWADWRPEQSGTSYLIIPKSGQITPRSPRFKQNHPKLSKICDNSS